MTHGADLDAALIDVAHRAVSAVPGATRAWVLVGEAGALRCRASVGDDAGRIERLCAGLPDLTSAKGLRSLRLDHAYRAARDALTDGAGDAERESEEGILLVPFAREGAPPGVLAVQQAQASPPNSETARVLELLGDIASAALARRRLFLERTQTALEVRLREEVLDGIAVTTGIQDVTESVAHAIKLLLPNRRWSIVNLSLLRDGGRAMLVHEIAQRPTDAYWGNVRRGVQAAAIDFHVEAEFRRGLPTGAGSQSELVDEAIRRGFHGIAIAPSAALATEPAIRRAREAGVAVVTFDSPPVPNSAALLYLGTDNLAAGRLAGRVMAKLTPKGSKIASLVGSRSIANGDQRISGFEAGAAAAGLVPLPCIEDNRVPELGPELTSALLDRNADLVGAFGAWDDNGPTWAMSAARAGRSGRLKVVAFDLALDTVAMLQDGSIHVAVVQREAEMGYRSVQVLSAMAASGAPAVLACLPSSRVVDIGVDLVTLERTPWSTELAEHLASKRWTTLDPVRHLDVVRSEGPTKVMVIGMAWPTRGDVIQRVVPYRPGIFVGEVMRVGEPRSIDHPAPAERDELQELVAAPLDRVRTLIGVPLTSRGVAIGVMLVGSEREGACAPGEVARLVRIASAATVAIDNARLVQALAARARDLGEEVTRKERLLDTLFELSCPVSPVAPGILAVPLVGALSGERGAHLTTTLLREVSRQRAEVVLVDVTGLSEMDTAALRCLCDTAAMLGQLGAEVVLVGVSARMAQGMVIAGLSARGMKTYLDLESGFAYALTRRGARIVYSGAS
jgi:anti-anti-sigma factor